MVSERTLERVALMERALRLTPAFAKWPASAMSRLLDLSKLGRYSRGEFIFSERDTLEALAIVSGHITIGRTPAGGSRTTVALLGPGFLIGITRALDPNDDEVYDYEALDDVTVVQLPSPLLLEILDQTPALWRDMAWMLLKQQREALNTLMKQFVGSLPHRLAGIIERLSMLYGSHGAGEPRALPRLTQEDLAAMLHVSRQSVNKDLQALVSRGAISIDYNTITILDMAELKKAAIQT